MKIACYPTVPRTLELRQPVHDMIDEISSTMLENPEQMTFIAEEIHRRKHTSKPLERSLLGLAILGYAIITSECVRLAPEKPDPVTI